MIANSVNCQTFGLTVEPQLSEMRAESLISLICPKSLLLLDLVELSFVWKPLLLPNALRSWFGPFGPLLSPLPAAWAQDPEGFGDVDKVWSQFDICRELFGQWLVFVLGVVLPQSDDEELIGGSVPQPVDPLVSDSSPPPWRPISALIQANIDNKCTQLYFTTF